MEEIAAMTSRSSELCFNKDDFTAKDFSVDQFVSEYRKQIPLETLKEDLGLFLKVLQSAMVELINKDYADFVNLSTNLVGLDKSINNLRTPIEHVKTEITNFCSALNNTLNYIQKLTTEKDDAHVKKSQLYSIMRILEGITNIEKQNLKPVKTNDNELLPCELLERIALELRRVQFHIKLTLNVRIVHEKLVLVEEISDNLLQHLELVFLQSLTNNSQENLCKVLRIYALIDKIEEVENKFRIKIVRPYMREVIHENIIATEGIDQMYNYVLDFIPRKCSLILSVTRCGQKDMEILKGYDFLVNSVWQEIIICLEYIASTVFAPGNPSLFHKNFSASMAFLEKFEQSCVVQTSVKRLREHISYETFMKKWNTHVYFEIRFQEIGSTFETALLSAFVEPFEKSSYHLNATCVIWKCITSCWDSHVYISSLCSEFWKLTLQLLSRFHIWISNIIKETNADDYPEDPVFQGLLLNREDSRISVVILMLLIEDIELSIREIEQYFQLVIISKLPVKKEIFYNAIKQQIDLYSQLPEQIGRIIVKRLTNHCSQHLKLISDIPRLYRKTNREVPSKPSSYVTMIFSPLETFLSNTESISAGWKSEWTNMVIDQVIQQCYHMITDVITSVKKMEDSLKRLKKARDKPVGHITSGIMSDDDKIRHQLFVDVQVLGTLIKKYQNNECNVNYKKLEELVQSAIKTSNVKS